MAIKGTKLEGKTFQPGDKGKDQKRGAGGARAGSGPKPKVIKDLEKSWRDDVDSVQQVVEKLKDLALNALDENVQVSACRAYLDRVVGRPKLQIELDVQSTDLVEVYQGLKDMVKAGAVKDLLQIADDKTLAKARKSAV